MQKLVRLCNDLTFLYDKDKILYLKKWYCETLTVRYTQLDPFVTYKVLNMNSLVMDRGNIIRFSRSLPYKLTESDYKKLKISFEIMRKFNDIIKCLLKCHEIISKLISKVNSALTNCNVIHNNSNKISINLSLPKRD